MSTYNGLLPNVFPYSLMRVPAETVRRAVEVLSASDEQCNRGSSFAVVAGVWYEDDERDLWLSRASHQRLVEAGIIKPLEPVKRGWDQ